MFPLLSDIISLHPIPQFLFLTGSKHCINYVYYHQLNHCSVSPHFTDPTNSLNSHKILASVVYATPWFMPACIISNLVFILVGYRLLLFLSIQDSPITRICSLLFQSTYLALSCLFTVS